MKLYHGSIRIIKAPIFGYGKSNNDYGLGFYCTQNIDLAKEWAATSLESIGYVNEYNLNIDGLKILDLTDKKYSVLNWIAILVKYREFTTNSPISKQAKQFLIENYYIDVNNYDVIIGYRADDSYFRFAKDFLNNTLSIEALSKAMELGELGKQIVLKSQKAFERISFLNYSVVDNEIYYTKRMIRDTKARSDYFKLEINDVTDEHYINDIMRKR